MQLYDITKPTNSYIIMETYGKEDNEEHYMFKIDFKDRTLLKCV